VRSGIASSCHAAVWGGLIFMIVLVHENLSQDFSALWRTSAHTLLQKTKWSSSNSCLVPSNFDISWVWRPPADTGHKYAPNWLCGAKRHPLSFFLNLSTSTLCQCHSGCRRPRFPALVGLASKVYSGRGVDVVNGIITLSFQSIFPASFLKFFSAREGKKRRCLPRHPHPLGQLLRLPTTRSRSEGCVPFCVPRFALDTAIQRQGQNRRKTKPADSAGLSG
jgi:hypothetical protein